MSHQTEEFVHLHIHSEGSIGKGITTAHEIAIYSPGNAAAITDLGNMTLAVEFQKEMLKIGKKPIFGIEACVDSVLKMERKTGYRIILLAKNDDGIKALFKLSSMGYENLHYKKPIIKWDWIKKDAINLICLTGSFSGEIPILAKKELNRKKPVLLDQALKEMKSIFNEDIYIEIQRHGLPKEDEVNNLLLQKGLEYSIKPVATTNAHMAIPEHRKAHHVAQCIHKGNLFRDKSITFTSDGYYLKSAEEMLTLFQDIPQAVYNTKEVADKCNGKIQLGNISFPKFSIPKGVHSQLDYLKKLAEEGLKRRLETNPLVAASEQKYRERLSQEINMIHSMNYTGYFLIVWDIIEYCKINSITTGPGRGSAVGSLLVYLLGITEIDPLQFNLSFDRFVNPNRVSLPDIDVDVEHNKREEVLQYIRKKYGANNVTNILSIKRNRAKSVFKDVCRVFGFHFNTADSCAKCITYDIRSLINDTEAYRKVKQIIGAKTDDILDLCLILEDRIRSYSVHTSGILIAPGKINNFLPIRRLENDTVEANVSQVEAEESEELGILKFDILPLRMLTALKNTENKVNRQGFNLNLNRIDLTDIHVYRTLTQEYAGIFQADSLGMRRLLKTLFRDINNENCKSGDAFEKLIAAIALYRPGPMDEINNYIKASENIVTYDTPALEPILKNTFGIFIYQEQIIQAVQLLAGYSGAQADDIRKAIGKKIKHIINENEVYFIHGSARHDALHPDKAYHIKGCIENGIPIETAKLIWEKIKKFGEYAFNKSHAAAYANLTYKTAYCFTYYKEEYIASLLDAYCDDKKFKYYISKLKNIGISIYPPKIYSAPEFTVIKANEKKHILFGLKGIAGIQSIENTLPASICKEATSHDLLHFLFVTYLQVKKNINNFAYAGVFDDYMSRKNALTMTERFITFMQNEFSFGNLTWDFLLGKSSFDLSVYMNRFDDELEEIFKLKKEKEVLSCYVSNHPVKLAPPFISKEITQIKELPFKINQQATILCSIEEYKVNQAKNKKSFARLTVEDTSGTTSCLCFSNEFIKYHHFIETHPILLLDVFVSESPEHGTTITVKNAKEAEDDLFSSVVFLTNNFYSARICAHKMYQAITFQESGTAIYVQYDSESILVGHIADKQDLLKLIDICNTYTIA